MDKVEDIRDFVQVSAQLATSGQPNERQFAVIQQAGYSALINLVGLTSADALANEAEIVADLGLVYVHIPVEWEAPTLMDLRQFVAVMARYVSLSSSADCSPKCWVHCIANKRVSVFVYLFRVLVLQADPGIAHDLLLKVWHPNPIWEAFIASALAHPAEGLT